MSEKNLVNQLFANEQLLQRREAVRVFGVASPLYAGLVARTLHQQEEAETLEQALSVVHRLQRLNDIAVLGLETSAALFEAMQDEQHFPLWDQFAALAIPDEDKEAWANLMYIGDPQMRQPILLTLYDYSRGLAEKILTRILQNGDGVDIRVQDEPFHRRLLHVLGEERAASYGTHVGRYYTPMNRRIDLAANNPSVPFCDPAPAQEIARTYRAAQWKQRRLNDVSQFYTLTYMPTPHDAALDGVPYDVYVDRYVAAIVKVDPAMQRKANLALIAKLNAASIVHITNSDGTDVHFDITGQTFANSLMNKNVPGSEVFSSPLINSANGRIVAKGKFMPMAADQIVEDITLDLRDGEIVSYDAEKGREYLAQVIETDPGSRRLGEFALGTNPVWRYHSVNGLVVEKIGGSFHVAIGWAYQDTEYMGEPVRLDNGNRSNVHWDITTMLHNKDGMISVDGEVIMEHGRYLEPELRFLNGPV